MNTLEAMNITEKSVFSVVGCNGKTSLINHIANKNIHKKVLVTPTTKIYPMTGNNIVFCGDMESVLKHKPQIGINCIGILDSRIGKLCSLPYDVLNNIICEYDLVLMEADGSKSLPCKGWAEFEPVILNSTTDTVGIVTLNGLNKPATEENVLRINEFLHLVDMKYGELISLENIAKMACEPNGMFKNAVGKKILLINQIEDEFSREMAKKLIDLIVLHYPNKIDEIHFGSIKNDNWYRGI